MDNGVESLSVEETNAIRLKLGLKPLAVQESGDKSEHKQVPPEEKRAEDAAEFHEARRSLIEGGSIADMLKRGEVIATSADITDHDESKGSTQPDLKAWSRRMAKIAASNRISAISYSDDEDEEEPKPSMAPKVAPTKQRAKLKVLHQVDELPLDKGDGVVLTLADVGILEAEAASVADVDFLENPEIPSKNPLKQGQSAAVDGDYNPYEEYEDDMLDGKPDILRKYDKVIDEYKGTKLKSLVTGKRGFYVNIDEETTAAVKRSSTALTQPTEETISFSGLKRKKDLLKNRHKPVNWDRVFKSAKQGTEDVNETEDQETFTKIVKKDVLDTDDVEECNELYNQLSRHRNRLLATVKPETTKKESTDIPKTSLIDTGVTAEKNSGLQLNSTSEFIYVVKPKVEEDQPVTQPMKSSTARALQQPKEEPEEESFEDQEGQVDNNAPMTMGIAEALSYLKDKGDLIEEKKDLSKIGNDINLQYIDEYGRRMTPKEAFRKISWRFHGKNPGLNKQERKIKRLERERLAKQNPLEGLPTIKALLTHQMETKSSHLVLSGNSNLQ